MKPTIEQRYEQHKRDGGKLSLYEFHAKAQERDRLHEARKAKRERQSKKNMRTQASLPLRKELASEIFDDLPDGAFFAASEDTFGVTTDDWIDQ